MTHCEFLSSHMQVSSMELLNESGFYALAGAAITAIPTALASWHSARVTERGKLQQILIQAAKDVWLERAKATNQLPPFEHQLVYSTLMAQLCADIHRLDDDAVRARVRKIRARIDILTKEAPVTVVAGDRRGTP